MSTRTRILSLALALAACAHLVPSTARADDRNLLRTSTGDPYVMILFDTSGSMNWAPMCTAAQVAAGICTYLCPTGDCPAPRDGDDPASKFRQAKEALYEVMREVDGVQFGFASFNQDRLGVQYKEWLYRVAAAQPAGQFSLAGGTLFPAIGSDEVFGATFACDRGNGDAEIGCFANGDRAADVNDVWEMTKVRRLPKLGDNLSANVGYYVRSGGQVYYVVTSNVGGQALGDVTMTLRTSLYICTDTPANNPGNGCNSPAEMNLIGTKDIAYDRVGDFVKWDYQVQRFSDQGGYDGVVWSTAGGTCNGWDPNDDSDTDKYPNNVGYSLRYATAGATFDPPGTADDSKFFLGDVIPLAWNTDNKGRIMNRLAPRLSGGDPTTDPEAFAVATYLKDHQDPGDNFLRLKNEIFRPLLPNGATPLGWSLKSVREWYRGCENGSCPQATGWDDLAAQFDPSWECRQKYLLVITDGDDTCPGRDPCSLTASMNALDDIKTFVVAFGVENTAGNRLNCMASNGGTGEPVYPQNKQELVDALRQFLASVKEEAVSFASAAVPTVQANIADKIFLSSFTPLNDQAVWPGRLDAFLKPLPLENGLPDRSERCVAGSVEAECFAWDAGDAQLAWDTDPSGYDPEGLLLQAPFPETITLGDNSTLQLGTGSNERRVFFGLPDDPTPGKRQWLRFPDPAQPIELQNYEFAFNLPTPDPTPPTNLTTVQNVVKFTLEEKRAEIDRICTAGALARIGRSCSIDADCDSPSPTGPGDGVCTSAKIQYLMGDIFHSNPLVLNPPSNFDLYTKDLYWNSPLCGDDLATTQARGNQISYDWFSNRNLCRRIMVFVGSNDTQLHAFDAGIFRGGDCKLDLPAGLDLRDAALGDGDGIEGKYDFGSGRELFSFIPNAMMPTTKLLSEITTLTVEYGIDGTPRAADVFIDPILDGAGNPTCQDRQWRTVLFGSYREGGPGIFALDVTQPDIIPTGDNVPTPLAGSPDYVPSCIDGGGNPGCKLTNNSYAAQMPFPSLLWEFRDDSDEDGVGGPDLAESWSRPFITRLRFCNGDCDQPDEPEDRWIAVFGGGIPETPANSSLDETGNWVYFVDVETGRILYKRGGDGVIEGAVATDVTGIDINVNGYVESLYFGTTAGFVYKIDLGEAPLELDGSGRVMDPAGLAGRFNPFQVFSTGGRPIYLELNAIYVTKLRAVGLLFGTGNRWDLWDFGGQEGRFYALVDTGWVDNNLDGVLDDVCGPCNQPLDDSSYEAIDPDAAFGPGAVDFLYGNPDPSKLPGWFFTLDPNEKLITEPFSLAGVTFFTVFSPTETTTNQICAYGGESKVFIVNTVNANGYAKATGSPDFTRYFTAPKFTTQPYTEPGSTKNPSGDVTPEEWTDELVEINAELKKLYPYGARFANYTINIKTIRSDTGIVFVAPVPVAIEPHNWKEY